jgi:hypothetical protein
VAAVYTPDGGVKAPCSCCNTFTSPGDRCRARRVITRAKSRVLPCRLSLANTPGPPRQYVGVSASSPIPAQGTPYPSVRTPSVVDKALEPLCPAVSTSTSHILSVAGEVPL